MSGNARSETGSVSASVRTEEDSGARTGELTPPKYSGNTAKAENSIFV